MDLINRSLEKALEQAAIRADNMENAAVIKLREQAVERIQQLQTVIEDQLDAHLENAKIQINQLQDMVTECKESWKTDAAELEEQQRFLKEDWKKDVQEFQERLESQGETWEAAVESENTNMKQLLGDLKTISDESREHLVHQTSLMEERLENVQHKVDTMITDLEQRFGAQMEEMERQILATNEERLANWKHLTLEADTNTRQLLSELEASSTEIKTHFTAETDAMEQRLKDLEVEIERSVAALQNQIMKAGEHIEQTVLEDATARLEQWKQNAEERETKSQQLLEDIKYSSDTFKAEFNLETQDMEQRLQELRDDMTARSRELQEQITNTAAETQTKVAEDMSLRLDRWTESAEEGDARSRQLLSDLENVAAETEKYISNEIGAVNGRLDSIQNKIDELAGHIENKISGAEEQALAMADAELEKWKQAVEEEDAKARQLLSVLEISLEDTQKQISDEITGVTRQIEGLQSKLDAAVSHIEVELANAVAGAKEQGLLLADEELEKWKYAIETQNNKAQELLTGMESSLGEAKQQVSDEVEEISSRLEALQTKLDETAAHIESEIAQAGANAQDQAALLAEQELERWKQAVETEDVKVQNVLAGIELSLGETKERISHEIGGVANQLETLQTKLNETASQIEMKITSALAEAQDQASRLAVEELDKWKEAAEVRDAEARQLLSELERSLDAAKQNVAEEITEITGKIGGLQTRIGEITAQIEGEIQKAVNTVENQASEMAASELERWKQSVEAEDAKIQEALGGLKTSLGDAKQQIANEITGLQDQFERLQTKIDETSGTIEGTMIEAVTRAEHRASEMASSELERWKQTVDAEDARIRGVLTDLEASLGDAANRLENLQTKIDDTSGAIETTMTEAMTVAEHQAADMASGELEKWKRTVEAEDARLRALLADLEASLGDAKERINTEILGAAEQFETLQTKINDTTNHIEGVIIETVGKAETQASQLAAEELETWKQAVEAEETKVQDLLSQLDKVSNEAEQRISGEATAAAGQFDDIQTQIIETADHIKTVMTEAVKDAEIKALTLSDRGLERWRTLAEEGDSRARQLLAELETASAATKQQLSDEIALTAGRFDEIQSKVYDIAAHIEEAMAQAVSNAEEKALTLTDRGLERWKIAAEEGDTRARQLFAELEKVSFETKQHVFDEITAGQEQFETLRRKIEDIAGDIENQMVQTVNVAEEKAAALAEAGLEQWKSAMEEGALQFEQWKQDAETVDAKVRQVMTDLETSFTASKQQISDNIADAEQRIRVIEDRIDEAVSLLENEMTLAVSKAKDKALTAATEEETKIQHILQTLEDGFTDTKTRLFEHIADAETRIGSIQSRIDGTYANIEEELVKAMDKAEEQALSVADAGIEKWKALVNEEDAKIKRLLMDLETVAAASERRLQDLQGYADSVMEDLKVQVEKRARDTEQQALEDMEARLEKWKSVTEAEDAKAQALLSTLEVSAATIEQRIQTIQTYMDDTFAKLEVQLLEAAKTMEQKVLEATDMKFEEYQAAQTEHFKQLETLADDTSEMDAELRRYMAEIETRVREDFLQFAQNSTQDRDKVTAEFSAAVELLKSEMEAVEQELTSLKTQAYENVSDQFRGFEDDFSKDLTERSNAIEQRLNEWQEALNLKFAGFMEASAAEYQHRERTFNEELQHKFTAQQDQLIEELEHLKSEAGDFEEGIRSQMKVADDSLVSFKTQMHEDIEEARNTADALVKTELGRYALTMADSLKQSQRDIEFQIKTVAEQVEARNQEIMSMLEGSRQELDKWQTGFTTELQGLDASMNEVRRRAQELLTESDERLSSIRSTITDADKEAAAHKTELFAHIDEEVKILDAAIKEADRHIKEFVAQTKLFERTDELKAELERRLEDLQSDFDRIDQRRVEAMDLEGQFVKIKRLEDEVNAKMTRFLSEKHRIEQMETEFNRLLQVSTAVEEKLAEVSNSDDTLQEIQIQIRKLNDALENTEEKYQRIEKKNQTLDTTNDGIDRNFKSLQESEKMTRHITDELGQLSAEINSLRSAIESLTEDNSRARETADKLSLLDTSLSTIEERIEEMQKARQWLARAETRLEDLNNQTLAQVKLMDTISRNTDKTIIDDDKGAPPLGVRDNIIRLARLGWTVDEIARAVKRSRGEVELVLEIMPKE
jgi:chromosome segregation ATPase